MSVVNGITGKAELQCLSRSMLRACGKKENKLYYSQSLSQKLH